MLCAPPQAHLCKGCAGLESTSLGSGYLPAPVYTHAAVESWIVQDAQPLCVSMAKSNLGDVRYLICFHMCLCAGAAIMRSASGFADGLRPTGLRRRAGSQHQAIWLGQVCGQGGVAGAAAAGGGLCQGAGPHSAGGAPGEAGAAVC